MSIAERTLYIVATPIGNSADITRRAIDVLAQVDVVYAEDTRRTRQLFQTVGVLLSGTVRSLHEHNESQRVDQVITHLLEGGTAAIVSDAGTPLISDPGYRVVAACHEQGVDVRTVPGASAVVAALSVSGLPTDEFLYVGFLPARREARLRRLGALALESRTWVMYESTHRIVACIKDLMEACGSNRRATLAKELTKIHETVLHGSLQELLDWLQADSDHCRGEFVVVVAGQPASDSTDVVELDRVLTLLLADLPVKSAAGIAATLLDVGKREAYQRALALKAAT